MGLTLLGLLFLYKYYDSMIAIKRLSGICLQPGVTYSSLRGAGLLSAFAWDVLIMLPIPLPGVDFTITVWNKGLGRSSDYTSDTVLCVICMFLRVSYLPRFYGECLSDLHGSASVAFARFNRIKLNETFTIKYVLAKLKGREYTIKSVSKSKVVQMGLQQRIMAVPGAGFNQKGLAPPSRVRAASTPPTSS